MNDQPPTETAPSARIGISLAADVRLAADVARRAEAAGFDDVWSSEFAHRSGTVPLAVMATSTKRVALGSAIVYAFGRSPAVLAGEASDLDRLSDGRLILGLGTAQPRRMIDWLGVDARHPAPRMAELVGLLRRLWRMHEESVDYEGRFYRAVISPFGEIEAPIRSSIPVYIAAVNRHMVRVAGRVGDGLIGHPLMSPEVFATYIHPNLDEAAMDRVVPCRTVGMVITCIADQPEVARREAATQVAFYATNATYDFILEHHGVRAEADDVRNAVARRDWDDALRAVSDEMVDAFAIWGTRDAVIERSRRHLALYDHVVFHTPSMVASPPPGSGLRRERYLENLEAILETFGAPGRAHD